MALPGINLLHARRSLSVNTKGTLAVSSCCARRSMGAVEGLNADLEGYCDPQLDPKQHRRRREPVRGSTSRLLPDVGVTQLPLQEPPPLEQLHPHLWGFTGQLSNARGAQSLAGGVVTAPGASEPGTVQDQSSCALLLPWAAIEAPSPGGGGPPVVTLPLGTAVGAGRADKFGGTAAVGDSDGAYEDNNSEGADDKECSDGSLAGSQRKNRRATGGSGFRLVSEQFADLEVGPPHTAVKATAPVAASAIRRGFASQQQKRHEQHQQALVTLWDGHAWAPPCGPVASHAAILEPWGRNRRRGPDAPAGTVAAGRTTTGPAAYGGTFSAGAGAAANVAARLEQELGEGRSAASIAVHAPELPRTRYSALVSVVRGQTHVPSLAVELGERKGATAHARITTRPCVSTMVSSRSSTDTSSTPLALPVLEPRPWRGVPTKATPAIAAARVSGSSDSSGCKYEISSLARLRKPNCECAWGQYGGSASGAADRRLMRAITGCRHWRQLAAVLNEHGPDMNALHVTAALGKLTRMQLPAPPRPLASCPLLPDPRQSGPPLSPQSAAGESLEVQALLSGLTEALLRFVDAAWARPDCSAGTRDGDNRASDLGNGRGNSYSSSHGGIDSSSKKSNPAAETSSMCCGAPTAAAAVHRVSPFLGPRQLATSLAALGRLYTDGWGVVKDPALLMVVVSRGWQPGALPSQELVTLLYSFAKLGHHPGRAWLDAACCAAAAAAADRRMCPRQLSTFLWALAKLCHPPGRAFMTAWLQAAVRAMARFSAYDISQALWALAALHRASKSPHRALSTAATMAESSPLQEASEPPHGLPKVFMRAALGRARAALHPTATGGSGCTPQDVCNVLWAVSQLQLCPPRAWVLAVVSALMSAPDAAVARCRSADLAGLLWALARMLPDTPPPRSEMLRIVTAAARLAPQFGEQDLANVLWALGSLRFVPPPAVMHAFGSRLLTLCMQGAARPQLLSTALWCCVRLRVPPRPALLRHLLAAAARHAPEFGPRSAPLLLYSLARLHHLGWLHPDACQPLQSLPQPPLQAQPQQPLQAAEIRLGTPAAAAWPAVATSADGRNGDQVEQPSGGSAGETALRAMAHVPQHKLPPPVDLSPFLDAALRGMTEAEVEVEGGRPRLALPVLLWSVARLSYQPDEGWTRAYLAHSFELLPQLSPAEASLVVSALLRLGALPPPLWLARMEHLLATRWGPAAEREAAQLRREVRALTHRVAAAADPSAAVAAATAPAVDLRATGPVVFGCAAGASSGAAAALQQHDRAWWRQRQMERRREVAARVLGKRREVMLRRLALLRVSMAGLRRSLARLRVRVWRPQPEVEQQQSQAAEGGAAGGVVKARRNGRNGCEGSDGKSTRDVISEGDGGSSADGRRSRRSSGRIKGCHRTLHVARKEIRERWGAGTAAASAAARSYSRVKNWE